MARSEFFLVLAASCAVWASVVGGRHLLDTFRCFRVQVAADAATITTVYPDRGSTEGFAVCEWMWPHKQIQHVKGGTYLVISGSGFMMPTEAAAWMWSAYDR